MMFGIKAHTMNPAAEILWGISLSALFFISGKYQSVRDNDRDILAGITCKFSVQ